MQNFSKYTSPPGVGRGGTYSNIIIFLFIFAEGVILMFMFIDINLWSSLIKKILDVSFLLHFDVYK